MIWTPSLKTGIGLIDDQHYEIFGFFDALFSLASEENMKQALVRLNSSTREHFKYEQQLQQDCRYPSRVMHKYHHDNYTYTYRVLQQQHFDKELSVENFIKQSKGMSKWLIDHIHTHDTEFASFYREYTE